MLAYFTSMNYYSFSKNRCVYIKLVSYVIERSNVLAMGGAKTSLFIMCTLPNRRILPYS